MKIYFKLLLVCLIGFTAISCNEDTDPNEDIATQLDGDWDVTSFTLDGVEQMGFSINTFSMDFKKENAIGGETDWEFTTVTGESQRLSGDFEVQNDGKEIDLDGSDLDISFKSNDRLSLDGNIDGQRWEIEADRDN